MPKHFVCKDCKSPSYGKRCRKCFLSSRKKRSISLKQKYAREWALKKKYNITLQDFEVYWIAQYGKCFICNEKMQMPKVGQRGQNLKSACVDHCHRTGKVRGLLCSKCNKGIGFLNDDPQLLQKAINYLNL